MWSVHEKIIQAEDKERQAAALGRRCVISHHLPSPPYVHASERQPAALGRRLGRVAESSGAAAKKTSAKKTSANRGAPKGRQGAEGRDGGKRARRRRSRTAP